MYENSEEINKTEPINIDSIQGSTKNTVPTTLITVDKSSGKPDLSKFSPAEIEKFKQKASVIKTDDNTSILNFGADVQTKIASTSNAFLSNVRAFDAGDIGGSITDLLTEINYIDIDPSQQPMWKRMLMGIPGLKNVIMSTKKIFQKYDTVSGNIDGIVKKLDQGRLVIIKDNNQLEMLFKDNVDQIHNLEELIIIGHMKRDELDEEIKHMQLNSADFEEYQINDKLEFLNRLDKRLHDMALTRMITIQSLPQIRLVQNNNMVMCEKIQQSIVTTIPIWKQQIAIAVALMRQKANLEVQNKIYETTNTILAKNAEMLKANSIDVAKQNERGVVDVETIRKVNTELISTLDEIKRIKSEGDAARRSADQTLTQLEEEISKTVLKLDTK